MPYALSPVALAAALALIAAQAPAQDRTSLPLVPRPIRVTRHSGAFTLTAATAIRTDAAFRDVGYALADMLAPATGFRLEVETGGAMPHAIVIRHDTALAIQGDEAYRLDVGTDAVTVAAAAPAGAFYAVQTLRQLLPIEIFREARVAHVSWTVPAVTIEDRPRFAWRGAHLDVSRHFMPKEFVKKFIDLLALHKLNRFHWHLTDDQGWRIAIARYPRLIEVGAWRRETLIGQPDGDSTQWRFDGTPHGGLYTQDDVREIVAYARQRFVTVVPEIEMPGHAQAAIAAYPELGNTGDTIPVSGRWGVHANILNPEDATIEFMQNVLTEVLALFPGPYIHVGGDEAVKDQWEASPRAQERIRELGLADAHELQSWFIRQMDVFLSARGRSLVGWDEILEGGLAANAVVMSWRGVDGGIAAARDGHDVVMAPTSHTYLDYYQSRDTEVEPLAIGGFLPLETVYAFDPVPGALSAAEARHVLGAQAQLWTEYMPSAKHVEYMAFPRLCALAEVVWSPRTGSYYDDFTSRLRTHLDRLILLDVDFRPLNED